MDEDFKGEDRRKKDRLSAEKFCARAGISDCATIISISSFEYDDDSSEDENIKELIKSLVKKLDRICDDMESVLDPGNSISDIKEAGFFDDNERRGIGDLFGRNKHLVSKAKLVMLEYDAKKAVSLANEITSYWGKNREQVVRFYEGLVSCWESDERSQSSLSYFG